jgi:hypothetical protein
MLFSVPGGCPRRAKGASWNSSISSDSGRADVVCPERVLLRGQLEIDEETGEFDTDGKPIVRRREADDEYLIRKGSLGIAATCFVFRCSGFHWSLPALSPLPLGSAPPHSSPTFAGDNSLDTPAQDCYLTSVDVKSSWQVVFGAW